MGLYISFREEVDVTYSIVQVSGGFTDVFVKKEDTSRNHCQVEEHQLEI